MSEKANAGRRDFLKLAGIGAVTGGAALAMGQDAAQAAAPDGKSSSGYRETEHVKTYYELARF